MKPICPFRKGDRGTNSVCKQKNLGFLAFFCKKGQKALPFMAEMKGCPRQDTLSVSQSKQANTASNYNSSYNRIDKKAFLCYTSNIVASGFGS